MARITSAFFVSALVRRAMHEGAFAALVRRGAEEAGVVFVLVDRLDGSVDLYGPAPQMMFAEDGPGDRLFMRIEAGVERPRATARIDSELRFDSDLWLVEIEDRQGRPFLDVVDPDRSR